MRSPTQLSRCFIRPIEDPPEAKGRRGGGRQKRTWLDAIPKGIIDALAPWAHPELIFDIETTTDALSGQRAKVGFWQQRGLKYEDRCNLYAQGKLSLETMDVRWQEGVFFNRITCPDPEIYAAERGLKCLEVQDFIRNVFYRQSKLNALIPEPKLIIGHNPVFDIGGMSRHTGKCRDEKLYGALSLGLCNCRQADEIEDAGDSPPKFKACGYHPNIKIKKLGPGKHIMECGAKYDGRDKTGKPKYVDACLEFLDTRQLARALLEPCDGSLEALCRMLKTPPRRGPMQSMV